MAPVATNHKTCKTVCSDLLRDYGIARGLYWAMAARCATISVDFDFAISTGYGYLKPTKGI